MRRILVETLWKMHPAEWFQFLHPPEGYEYVIQRNLIEPIAYDMSRSRNAVALFQIAANTLPLSFIRSIYGLTRKPSNDVSFTYSIWHMVLRHEPWVMEVADVGNFAFNEIQLLTLKHFIMRRLEMDNCKYLICWFNQVKEDLKRYFNSRKISEKIAVVPRAVTPKSPPLRKSGDDIVRILFVGSASQVGEFEQKGGPELLYAFKQLETKYPNIELIVRSDINPVYRSLISNDPRIRIISRVMTLEELDLLYRSSDIFVCPAHYSPWGTILEAMSYGLPVVVCNVYGMTDLVSHYVDGLIINSFETIYDAKRLNFSGIYSPYIIPKIEIDRLVVAKLVEYLSLLVSDRLLRERLGQAGRLRTMTKNSYTSQRRQLQELFDRI
jgi:glycosyltransferase involved in cell wall biosynthesis